MEGPIALQQGEDAVVLRETTRSRRGSTFSSGKKRLDLRLPDAHGGPFVPGGGRARSPPKPACRCPRSRTRKRRARRSAAALPTSWRWRRSVFEATLAGRIGAKARAAYLADRSLDPATQVKFRLGYSPGERSPSGASRPIRACRSTTWWRPASRVGRGTFRLHYDRFRDRVIFPIHRPAAGG